MNSFGKADPAMHHTMSGDEPPFHAMHSLMTREAPSASDTSAEKYWKRCVDGEDAEALI